MRMANGTKKCPDVLHKASTQTCKWSKTKKHPGSSHNTIFIIEHDFEALSEPLGKASCCTGKAFLTILQNLIKKKMHAQRKLMQGRCSQPWFFQVLNRAKKVPKREVNWWFRNQKKPNGLTYNDKNEKCVIIAAEVLKKWKTWVWP